MSGRFLPRRQFLRAAAAGAMGITAETLAMPSVLASPVPSDGKPTSERIFDVRRFGASGNGVSLDTGAINKAIAAAEASGGGTVYLPAGSYLSYSIHLKSNVALYLDPGAAIVAGSVRTGGATSGAYDRAESNAPWESYQDFGHNHWHNSLIWGEDLENIAILGSGLIWGKGLSRGTDSVPSASLPGMADKAIGLKNCRNVVLRDFSVLKGGHFALLATGVDNLTVDNLLIDTDQDGMDIDCCRNVRVSNCSVNSPWDDAICPKSSYALGRPRATENLTIAGCYVTGAYEMGTMLDGTWKRFDELDKSQLAALPRQPLKEYNGSIKFGTESNGGFKNITVSDCIFDSCKGLAVESSDGAVIEGMTFSGLAMRNCTNTPLFLRLGARMRGPAGRPIGEMRGIILSNIVSYNSVSQLGGGGILAGIPGHMIEDIKIHDVYLEHRGGGTRAMAALHPPEYANDKWGTPPHAHQYPDPDEFGDIPASGFFLRHVKNVEFSNVEIAFPQPEARPVFWLDQVDEVDFFNLKTPRNLEAPVFQLADVRDFRIALSRNLPDTNLENVRNRRLGTREKE